MTKPAHPTSEMVARDRRTKEMESRLRGLDEGLLKPPNNKLARLVNWSEPSAMPIHRWYRYREGYSPSLINDLNLGPTILDPFAGVGSIAVGAAQTGRRSAGIDVNPLAVFAANVKLTPLSEPELKSVKRFKNETRDLVRASSETSVPELKLARKVFEPAILETLLRLESAIEAWPASERARDFLSLARIAVMESVGSYYKEGNGIKYRNRKRLANGYVNRSDGDWQLERFGEDQRAYVLRMFDKKLSEMLEDSRIWRTDATAWKQQHVWQGTCLDELARLPESSYDSIIFSPPYVNRFDYFEAMKVELWFGRFVNSYAEMRALRKRSLRSHLSSDLAKPAGVIAEVEHILSLMDAESYAAKGRVRDLVRGYFTDITAVLSESRRVLKPGGDCHVIVGNSAYGGIIVPTDSIIARNGLKMGFESSSVTPIRHLTVSPQQRGLLAGHLGWMRESLVTLS